MKGKFIIALVVIIIIALAGGGYYYMQKGKAGGVQQNGQAAAAAQDTVQAQDVKVGDGTEAKPGTQVSVLYVGMLQDGTVFDSSEAHGNQPLVFTLGAQGLIPGFQIGVNGMKVGGERLLAIPPSLAYGDQDVKDDKGKVVIPAKSTIVFRVQLVKVEAAPAQPAAQTTPGKAQ